MTEPNPTPTPDSNQPTPPVKPRKKRRLWLKIPIALLILLVLFVLLLPTILSTGAARSIALGQANKFLNGKVDVADWSIGWTGGVDARGIKISDAAGKSLVTLDHFSTELPLTKAIFGKLPLGKVKIDGLTFDIQADEKNQLNVAQLVKPSTTPEQPKPASPDSKLPNVSADVEITNVHGTFQQAGKPPVQITSLAGNIKMPDINQPITNDFNIGVRVGDGPEGKITTSGSASAIKESKVAADSASAHQTLDVTNVDLHAIMPFLPPGTGIDNIAGNTNTHMAVDVTGGKSATLDVAVNVDNVAVGGPALKGDTFATKSFSITVPKLSAAFPDGLDKWQSGRITVGAAEGSAPIEVKLDQARVTATIDVSPQALLNLKDNQKPGSNGKISLTTNTDVGALAKQLKHLLAGDVAVTSGTHTSAINLTMTNDRADVTAVTDIKDVAGTRGGKAIALKPIHLEAGASDLGGGGKLPDLRDLKLKLDSVFATADFQGKSIADLGGQLDGQFDKVQSELSQFVDFGGNKLAGSFNATVHNQGDLTNAGGTAKVSADATLKDVKFGDDVNQPWVKAALSADLHRGDKTFVDTVKNALITLQTGNPNAPTVDVLAKGEADLTSGNKAQFHLNKANVDFAKLQAEFGKFIPKDLVLTGGSLSATADGRYDDSSGTKVDMVDLNVATYHATIQKRQPDGKLVEALHDFTLNIDTAASADLSNGMSVRVPKLNIGDSQQIFSVQTSGGDLVVNLPKTGGFSGSGNLAINADLARVNSMLKTFTGAQATVKTTSGDVRQGAFSLTLALAPGDGGQTAITGDGGITGLVISTATGQTSPEAVKITLRASGSADAVSASQLSVNSRFANFAVTDAQVNLKKTSPLDMLQSAKLAVDVPDLKLTKSLLDAFSPPTPGAPVASVDPTAAPVPPAPPLDITGGSLAVHADVSHSASGLALNVSDITGKDIAFKRGDAAPYQMKPINLQLAAAVDTGDGASVMQQIHKVTVTQLIGNLGVANLSMPTPITVTDLSAATPTAEGAIKLDGHVQDVTTLLAALQSETPDAFPYRGDFAVTEAISSKPGGVTVAGGVNVAKFQVLNKGGDVAFAEDQLVLANDVSMPGDFNSVAIKNLSANMQSSGALNLVVQNATVDDLKQARKINLGADLQYDLAKLWPIVHPMLLTPGQDDQYKDLKVAGQFKKSISVKGQYPADVPMQKAIQQLSVDAALAVGSFDYNGLSVQNLEVPVALRSGRAVTVYGDKPTGQNTAPVATANGGQLDLGNITIDLTQDPPRVSMPANKTLLTHATINPLFADHWLNKFINNPVFVGANQASGLVDVTMVSCDQLPAGKLVMQQDPANTGTATVKFSLTELHIGGQGVGSALGKVLSFINKSNGSADQSDYITANIKDATVSLANGIATQNINFQTGKYNLGFVGNVNMATQMMMPMTVNVPGAAVASLFSHDPNVLAAVPPQVGLVMTGPLSSPQVQWDQVAQKLVQDAVPNVIGNVLSNKLNKKKGGNDAASNQQNAPGQQNDPLGTFLNSLQKQRNGNQPPPQPQQPANQQQQQGQQGSSKPLPGPFGPPGR